MPTQPPYTAHIGNMSFDATQDDIAEVFAGCQVTSVRIVEDKLTQQPKGFGYVEFSAPDGLKKALAFQGASVKGRNIRVSIAEPRTYFYFLFFLSPQDNFSNLLSTAKERRDAREITDWTRKGPLPDLPAQNRAPERGGYQPKSFDTGSETGSDRPGRRGYEPADGKSRDFSNWERKGPMSPTAGQQPPAGRDGGRPTSKDGPQLRRASPAWGEGRSQDGGSRPPRREFQEKGPTAPELDNQWRARMQPDAPPPPSQAAAPSQAQAPAPGSAAPAPAMRPKLNLQKRTVPEEVASPSSATSGDSKASPFGAAKPIDTAAKEKEIEERREARHKEAEEKAKADKAEKQRIAKEQEEAKQKAPKAESTKAESTPAADSKDGGSDFPQSGKNFEILQRVGELGDELPSVEPAEHAKTEEKTETSPKETTRPAPAAAAAPAAAPAPQQSSKANGNWRNSGNGNRSRGGSQSQSGHRNSQARPPRGQGGQGQAPANGSPPAPAEPEEDGWSTVSSKQRNPRRGGSQNNRS